VKSFLVVVPKPVLQAMPEFGAILKGMEEEVVIFHGPPWPFDENIIQEVPPAIHADLDAMGLQNIGKSMAGKLTALIGIENLRAAVKHDRLFQRRHAKFGIKGI
jgi:hypothetical protein